MRQIAGEKFSSRQEGWDSQRKWQAVLHEGQNQELPRNSRGVGNECRSRILVNVLVKIVNYHLVASVFPVTLSQ